MMSFLEKLGWAFLYVVAGLILAMPYMWLSDGTVDAFPVVVLVGPALLILLIALFKAGRQHEVKRAFALFWALCAYFNLPIILRFAAMGLKALGHAKTANSLFMIRFDIVPMLFFLGIVLVLLLVLVFSIKEWLSGIIKRKSQTI
jgi:hypothetical protein